MPWIETCQLNGLCSILYIPFERKCVLKLVDVEETVVLGGNVNLSLNQMDRASDLIHFKPCMYTHMRGSKRLESSRQMLLYDFYFFIQVHISIYTF